MLNGIGTGTVSKQAKNHFGNAIHTITLDNAFNEDGAAKKGYYTGDMHLQWKLGHQNDPKKWARSFRAHVAKVLGGPIQIVGLWASPPCTEYSRAKTSTPYCQKEAAFEEADKLIRFTLAIIFELAAEEARKGNRLTWVLENPAGGYLARREVMAAWQFFDVSYCMYGHQAQKHTRLWNNLSSDMVNRWVPKYCGDGDSPQCEFKKQHGRHKRRATGRSPHRLSLRCAQVQCLSTRCTPHLPMLACRGATSSTGCTPGGLDGIPVGRASWTEGGEVGDKDTQAPRCQVGGVHGRKYGLEH